MPEARSVTLGAWVRVGGRDEPDGPVGRVALPRAPAVQGHRGPARPPDRRGGRRRRRGDERLHRPGAHRVLRPAAPRAAGARRSRSSATCSRAPALRPDEVEAERQVIVEEILMNLDAPEDRVHTLLSQAAVRRPPARPGGARRPRTPWRPSAATTSPGSSRRGTGPRTMVVAAAGRLDHQAVVDAVAAAFSSAAGRRAAPSGRRPAPSSPRSSSSTTTPSRPTSASGGGACHLDDDDRWALAVANQILGGGMASRLFQEVREERGLAYSVYSHPSGVRRLAATSRSTAAPRPSEPARPSPSSTTSWPACWPTGSPTGSWPWPPATSRDRCSSAWRTAGGRMGRLGRSLDAARRDHPDRRARGPPPPVTVDDVARVLQPGARRAPGCSPRSAPSTSDALPG